MYLVLADIFDKVADRLTGPMSFRFILSLPSRCSWVSGMA